MKRINITTINKEILEKSLIKCNRQPAYLVMNKSTEQALSGCYPLDIYNYATSKGYYGTFVGIDIANCEKLKFGEIDFVWSIE